MSLKKYLLLLIILIGSNLGGHTQDTICLEVPTAKKVLADAYKYRYTDSLLRITERQLSEKKEEVRLLEEKGQEVDNNYRREIANLEGQVATLKSQVNGFEAMWRKERRRRRLTQAGGVVAAGVAIYLSIK